MPTRPSTDRIVDSFVTHLIASVRPGKLAEDVPLVLRASPADAAGFVDWTIQPIAAAPWIASLESRLPRPFPPSFRSLVMRYAFPSIDIGPLHLFANTGEPDINEELATRVFADSVMAEVLLRNGYVQIGKPEDGSYDPVCFDMNVRRTGGEYPLVRLDHEAVLQHGPVRIEARIAESFVKLLAPG